MRVAALLILFTLFFTSCIKDSLSECPSLFKVNLFVKDKNYFNSSEIGEPFIDENLPFRQYINNIHYRLQNAETGKIVLNSAIIVVTGEAKEMSITIDDIPEGEYKLTVWGNIEGVGTESYILHDNNKEKTDLYMGVVRLNVAKGVAQDKSLGMERTKGKLLLRLKNLPEFINKIEENITSVYGSINNEWLYSNVANVQKVFLRSELPLSRMSTFLAPSIAGEETGLRISLFTKESETSVFTPSIAISINRNEITAITMDYNAVQSQLEIWLYINNEWTLIEKLDISQVLN
ncbi:MAG: hypothetical protein GX963_06645 [Bacteroidales bacterium]|nr:hypothetical protein [Bacteroidales bacterium]